MSWLLINKDVVWTCWLFGMVRGVSSDRGSVPSWSVSRCLLNSYIADDYTACAFQISTMTPYAKLLSNQTSYAFQLTCPRFRYNTFDQDVKVLLGDLCDRIGMLFEMRKPFLPEEIWMHTTERKLYLVDVYKKPCSILLKRSRYQEDPWVGPQSPKDVDHFQFMRTMTNFSKACWKETCSHVVFGQPWSSKNLNR